MTIDGDFKAPEFYVVIARLVNEELRHLVFQLIDFIDALLAEKSEKWLFFWGCWCCHRSTRHNCASKCISLTKISFSADVKFSLS